MSVAVDASGVRELAYLIRGSAAGIGVKASAAVRKTAHDIEADAKGFAPVDTGFLKGSISTTITGGGVDTTAVIGPTAEYGIYQELGTSKMSAHPYLAPAFDRRIGGLERSLSILAGRL